MTTFTGLHDLGLEVVGQLFEPYRAVLACRVVERMSGVAGAAARARRETR